MRLPCPVVLAFCVVSLLCIAGLSRAQAPPQVLHIPATGATLTIIVDPALPPPPPADTTPPSIPGGLTVMPLSPTSLQLTWQASTDNLAVTGYQVSRDGIAGAPAPAMSLLVADLTPGTTYTFTIVAVDAAGNRSLPSPPVQATTPPLVPPPVDPLPPQVAVFRTHHDTIPNFAQAWTVRSAKDGAWSDPASWTPPHVPAVTDIVLITHAVTYDLPTGEVDTVGIAAGGVLTFSTAQPTSLTVRTMLVQPQGTLRMGTLATPIPAALSAMLFIKDLPIDLVKDPMQYGHGLLAIDGTVTIAGAAKEPTFVRLATEPKAGDTTLTLASPITGWQVGDRVVIPDTRQLAGGEVSPNDQTNNVHRLAVQTEVRTIASVTPTTLALTAPLTFDHLGARDTAGTLDFLPHVGNLTRNVVIRSANPAGTRGHTLFTGRSVVDIRHAAFVSLGRTKAEALDSTVVNTNGVVTHLGKNQIGRYALHNHHNFGVCVPAMPYQFSYVGNVVEDTGRWGLTVHGSHYGLVQENVIYNVKGAGIVLEDGSETGNLITRNLVVRVENTSPLLADEAESNVDPHGRKGNGIWVRGMGSIVRNNVVADTREGYGLYVGSTEGGAPDGPEMPVDLPVKRCSNTTMPGEFTTVDMLYKVPNAEFSGNEAYSTSEMGVGVWVNTGEGKPFTNLAIWHAAGIALFMKYTDPRIEGLVIRNQGGAGVAIRQQNNFGYGAAVISKADIQGVAVIWQRGGQITLPPNIAFNDGFFASRYGFQLDANGQANGADLSQFVLRTPRFLPLPGLPLKTISTSFVHDGDRVNIKRVIQVIGYQGNAADTFRVFFAAQAPAAPVYYLRDYPDLGPDLSGCPVVVPMTNQACWDKYKIATFRELARCADTTTHPEIGGFTCP